MNHLAHAWLAAPDEDLMFGGLIADFVRGAPDPALTRGVQSGIALHRAIDTFTDAHSEVAAARALFEPPYRRYAGILLDVWFDHLLARDWSRHAEGSLQVFSRDVQTLLTRRHAELPPRMHGFVRYMLANELPERYREVAMIGDVLQGLSRRLSRANPIADALPVLVANAGAIEARFEMFLPDLVGFVARKRAGV